MGNAASEPPGQVCETTVHKDAESEPMAKQTWLELETILVSPRDLCDRSAAVVARLASSTETRDGEKYAHLMWQDGAETAARKISVVSRCYSERGVLRVGDGLRLQVSLKHSPQLQMACVAMDEAAASAACANKDVWGGHNQPYLSGPPRHVLVPSSLELFDRGLSIAPDACCLTRQPRACGSSQYSFVATPLDRLVGKGAGWFDMRIVLAGVTVSDDAVERVSLSLCATKLVYEADPEAASASAVGADGKAPADVDSRPTKPGGPLAAAVEVSRACFWTLFWVTCFYLLLQVFVATRHLVKRGAVDVEMDGVRSAWEALEVAAHHHRALAPTATAWSPYRELESRVVIGPDRSGQDADLRVPESLVRVLEAVAGETRGANSSSVLLRVAGALDTLGSMYGRDTLSLVVRSPVTWVPVGLSASAEKSDILVTLRGTLLLRCATTLDRSIAPREAQSSIVRQCPRSESHPYVVSLSPSCTGPDMILDIKSSGLVQLRESGKASNCLSDPDGQRSHLLYLVDLEGLFYVY